MENLEDTLKKILVIDDEISMRKIYSRLLHREGFEAIEALNPKDAMAILNRDNVDLVLLDINMPEMDGQQLYGVIREYHPRLKVIVSSVYHLDEQKQTIVGATDYFDKSQGVLELLDKIREALGDESSV